jgi:hypothetical protein
LADKELLGARLTEFAVLPQIARTPQTSDLAAFGALCRNFRRFLLPSKTRLEVSPCLLDCGMNVRRFKFVTAETAHEGLQLDGFCAHGTFLRQCVRVEIGSLMSGIQLEIGWLMRRLPSKIFSAKRADLRP